VTRPNADVADQTGPDGPKRHDAHDQSGVSEVTEAVSDATDDHDYVDDDADWALVPSPAGAPAATSAEAVMAEPSSPVRMRWRLADLGVIAFYLAAAYRVTSGLWQSPTSLTPNVNGTDQAFFEWMLEHAVRIFTHGENPFFTHQLNYPDGVNLMLNTNLLGLGIPLAPLTALFGPSLTFVLIIFLGLSGTAFAWYYVLSRHIVHNRVGAFVGGAICGFGPGIITHANAHPNITAQFVLPFIVWRALALRNSTRPYRDGAILGLLIAYQSFLNEELLFLTALGGTVFALCYVAFRPRIIRTAFRPVALGLMSTCVVAGVLLAYPMYYMFYGPQRFSGLPDFLRGYPYMMSLESWVELPTLSIWGQPPGTGTTPPSGTEQNSLLGWLVVLAALAIVIVLWRRRPAVRALAIVGVLFAWASLGDKIVIRDNQATVQYYPRFSLWGHLSHLPLFDSVLSSRNGLVVLPVVGVLFAYGVTEALRALSRSVENQSAFRTAALTTALAGIAAACISIVPTPVQTQPRPRVPEFITSGDWRRYVPAGESVLSATPFDYIPFMMWSLSQNLDMNVDGGYFLGPDSTIPKGKKVPLGAYGPQWRQTMIVLGAVGNGSWELPQDDSNYAQGVASDLRFWKTAIIVLSPGSPDYDKSKDAITRLLNDAGSQIDDCWVWDVRKISESK
jgi:hypothetical protein